MEQLIDRRGRWRCTLCNTLGGGIAMSEFEVDTVQDIVRLCIGDSFNSFAYDSAKLDGVCNQCCERCLVELRQLEKKFKYAVSCVTMQKNGAGMHTAAACFWDVVTDGYCRVSYENDDIHVIVTVFGMAVAPSGLAR